MVQPEGQGTPSLSPTPSPAGSVGSVGSQSSGYSSGELANRGAASGQPQPAPYVSVPLNVHNAMAKQNHHFSLLLSCHDLWDQANALVTDKHRGECFAFTNHFCSVILLISEIYIVERNLLHSPCILSFYRFFHRAG